MGPVSGWVRPRARCGAAALPPFLPTPWLNAPWAPAPRRSRPRPRRARSKPQRARKADLIRERRNESVRAVERWADEGLTWAEVEPRFRRAGIKPWRGGCMRVAGPALTPESRT
jgi:hypothetical protein